MGAGLIHGCCFEERRPACMRVLRGSAPALAAPRLRQPAVRQLPGPRAAAAAAAAEDDDDEEQPDFFGEGALDPVSLLAGMEAQEALGRQPYEVRGWHGWVAATAGLAPCLAKLAPCWSSPPAAHAAAALPPRPPCTCSHQMLAARKRRSRQQRRAAPGDEEGEEEEGEEADPPALAGALNWVVAWGFTDG